MPKGKVVSAKVIPVIEVITYRGSGTSADPVRKITEYWDLGGELLIIDDPCAKNNSFSGGESGGLSDSELALNEIHNGTNQ